MSATKRETETETETERERERERERELGSAGEAAATPPTFAEYLGGAGSASKGCSRCAKPATVRVQLAVRPMTGKLGGVQGARHQGQRDV